MKKLFTALLLSSMVFGVMAQEEATNIKKGWTFGALPTITYSTDLGFQYGALVDLYNYGNGETYPEFLDNVYIEASRYTKGSETYRISYDTKHLIPGVRITSDLAYLPDAAQDFYGFNGYEAYYKADWIDDESNSYKTRMFYKLQNKKFRFKTDFQIGINDNLKALVGFNLQSFNIDHVNIDKMNKGKEDDDPDALPDVNTLYDDYVDWGIISAEEADGGFVPVFKVGLVYDTRDFEKNPMKGMWTEVSIFGAPEFLGCESSFLKLNITHRQYFTLIKNDLSLAYRLSYQSTVLGDVPFYFQNVIETSDLSDRKGLGGAKTIRGVNLNRIVGDGFVYGNVELRWKFVYFNLWNQNFYLGLNGFADFGQIVKYVKNDVLTEKIADSAYSDYFSTDGESMHMGFGAGLRIAMNQNFIVAVDYAKAPNEQDGSGTGFYIGLNYLF